MVEIATVIVIFGRVVFLVNVVQIVAIFLD
jgi:hypothetical protein